MEYRIEYKPKNTLIMHMYTCKKKKKMRNCKHYTYIYIDVKEETQYV